MSSVQFVPAVQYNYINFRWDGRVKIEEIFIPSLDITFNSEGQVFQIPDIRHPYYFNNDFFRERSLTHINLRDDFVRKMASIAKARLEAEKKLRQLWEVDAIKQCKL